MMPPRIRNEDSLALGRFRGAEVLLLLADDADDDSCTCSLTLITSSGKSNVVETTPPENPAIRGAVDERFLFTSDMLFQFYLWGSTRKLPSLK